MTTPVNEHVAINARIEIRAETLRTIVANMKQLAGADEKGMYRIDTAEGVSRMITAFLEEHGFDAYARDLAHYRDIIGTPR